MALGTTELILIGLVVLLFFGAAKIPDLARALGRAKGEFEKGARESRQQTDAIGRTVEDAEQERVLKAARELGIPTEGRALADVKADVRARLS